MGMMEGGCNVICRTDHGYGYVCMRDLLGRGVALWYR